MLHAKFRGNRFTGSGEEDFLKGFNILWAWRPSWSRDSDASDNILFSLPIEAQHKYLALIYQAVSENKMFEHCERTPTDGRRVYYKLTYEPLAQVN